MKITNITWENVYLTIELMDIKDGQQELKLVRNSDGQEYSFVIKNGKVIINITNISDCGMLPEGTWNVAEKIEGTNSLIEMDLELGYRCAQLDRVFPYYQNAYAYIVMIQTVEGQRLNLPGCMIRVMYMQKNRKPSKRKAYIEADDFSGIIKKYITFFFEKLLRLMYKFSAYFCKKDGRHILFMSETRTPISGNLKAIDERIKERELNYKISYSFFKSLQQSKIRTLLMWIKLIPVIARQDYVFVDDYAAILRILDLDKRTTLIQVWHAGVGFKSVGYARFGREGSPHPIESGHRKYDYAVVGGKSLIPVYQEVFGIEAEKFLPVGLPRLDNYLNVEVISRAKKKIYEQYSFLKGKKLILFAPTYRGKGQADAYYPYEKIDLKTAYKVCGEKFIFGIKMHPFVLQKINIPLEYQDRIKDMSDYEDINELFYVTDILITDFSSNIYEYSLQERPIIFYAFDKDIYQLQRGVHRTLDEAAAGKICETFDEVIECIQTENFELDKTIRFKQDNFNENIGSACDKIIDIILK